MELLIAFTIGVLFSFVISLLLIKGLKTSQENKFKVIAQEILNQNSEQFQKTLLNPIKDYQSFIAETHEKDLKERSAINERISQMISSAQKIERETHQLSKALTTDVKFQGNWGELTLERILELAGLEKGREYQTQSHFEHQGKSLRPDVVIHLPDRSHIIIDSKVSLKSYFEYLEVEDEQKLKELKLSVKTHIDQLSQKNYQMIEEISTPEFVYLFIPVEGVYGLILRNFPEILEHALAKNIVLVSPVNLMANLKTVAALWRIDKQSKSASEIAQKAGAMYDKFALMLDEMEKLGASLQRSQNLYHDIEKKLGSGRGNLIEKASELKEMGAKTSKSILTGP